MGEGEEMIEKTQQLLPDQKRISEPCVLGNQVTVVAGWGVGGIGDGPGREVSFLHVWGRAREFPAEHRPRRRVPATGAVSRGT